MFNVKALLSNPAMYKIFSKLIGVKRFRSFYVDKYVRPQEGDKILDIGCGPGDMLESLPNVKYVGFDLSQKYIDAAIKRFGNRGLFLCRKIDKDAIKEYRDFDIILANGVLHHLTDNEAIQLFELAKSVMKPSGRLITFDGCYIEGQSLFANYLLSKDRGKFVRTKNDYISLASKIFPRIKANIEHNLLHIPYTHIILECSL